MSERLGLDHVALKPQGPTLSLSIQSGQGLSVMGPAASGKSLFLRIMAGTERPAQGSVSLSDPVAFARPDSWARRSKPMTLARNQRQNSAARATELLLATRLWEVRNELVTSLSPSQIAAAELLEALGSDAGILLIDGQLDRLDPWARHSVLGLLKQRQDAGGCVIVATHRPEITLQMDAVMVLNALEVKFAGSLADLLRFGPDHVLAVKTDNQPAVRALVDPFEIRITETPTGLTMVAPEGQALAAKLLLEGYGDVSSVILRQPTLEEALLALLS